MFLRVPIYQRHCICMKMYLSQSAPWLKLKHCPIHRFIFATRLRWSDVDVYALLACVSVFDCVPFSREWANFSEMSFVRRLISRTCTALTLSRPHGCTQYSLIINMYVAVALQFAAAAAKTVLMKEVLRFNWFIAGFVSFRTFFIKYKPSNRACVLRVVFKAVFITKPMLNENWKKRM